MQHVVQLVRLALAEAKVDPSELDCICYTKGGRRCVHIQSPSSCTTHLQAGGGGAGPGMGAPLRSVAVCARMLSQLWDKPLVAVNHCVGRILPPVATVIFATTSAVSAATVAAVVAVVAVFTVQTVP